VGAGRHVLLAIVAVTLALSAAACGKRGDLDPPPGEPSDFPRQYPR
jgi:predicted small lipoprotein YifL